ncbi:PQQ-binding-like beta-propeller repeat protein [Nocardioides dilutus]
MPSPSPSEPFVIAGGVTLEPGSDGNLPVSVRWLRSFYALEHIATDGAVVYVSDEVVAALDASTGNYLWEASDPRGDCLCADGGVVIGTQGPDRLRVWAPYNYDLTVDRGTGEIVRLTHRAGGDKPADLKRMKGSRPEEYAINVKGNGVVARTSDGRVAWRILVDEPWFHPGPALALPGGLVVQLASGHVLALDYTTS